MADSDHYIEICYSKDGGRNWSNWKRFDLGATGEYSKRIRLWRLGWSIAWVYRIRVTSPRKHDLLGAVLAAEQTNR